MEKTPQIRKFHGPLKTNKLTTFSDMNKKKQVQTNDRSIILKQTGPCLDESEILHKNEACRWIPSFLGPLSWALSTPDDLLRKTNEASLASLLQKNVQFSEELPVNSASVMYGMSLVQRLKGDHLTGDVAMTALSMAVKGGVWCNRIDVVFDTYKELSSKNSGSNCEVKSQDTSLLTSLAHR